MENLAGIFGGVSVLGIGLLVMEQAVSNQDEFFQYELSQDPSDTRTMSNKLTLQKKNKVSKYPPKLRIKKPKGT